MRWMLSLMLGLLLLLPLTSCVAAEEQLEVFSLVPLQLGKQQIQVQLADTPQKRAQGLMFQQSAEPGMFLLYQKPTAISLWMANTAMALDVAYIAPDWTIVQLVQLEPFDETPVPSPGAVIAALEMPRGWFASHGIAVGQKVTFNP
ncbi:MAG TPA: DUF192 domain-containing protein [Rheinheimera sp.]|nr:DUF192 domain-containing protein [Rheinheimera sp.]